MSLFENGNLFSDSLEQALILEGIEDHRQKWDHYEFNGKGVPRVTEILKETIGREYLQKWAASLGDKYKETSLQTLDTGSLAHEMIEDFILLGEKKRTYDIHHADWYAALNCYNNFAKLWHDIYKRGYQIEPIFIEKQISTPYYGGTIDACFHITGNGVDKTYLVDFKSSKQISFEYYIQLMYYYIAIEYNRQNGLLDIDVPKIDGIGVIRVDKFSNIYEYVIADNILDMNFLKQVEEAVYSMLDWFYRLKSINYSYRVFKKGVAFHGDVSGHS